MIQHMAALLLFGPLALIGSWRVDTITALIVVLVVAVSVTVQAGGWSKAS